MPPATRACASIMGRVCPTVATVISRLLLVAGYRLLDGSPSHDLNDLFSIPCRAAEIRERLDRGGIGTGNLFDQGICQAFVAGNGFSGFDLLWDLRNCSCNQPQLLAATVRFIVDNHSHADAGPILRRTRNVLEVTRAASRSRIGNDQLSQNLIRSQSGLVEIFEEMRYGNLPFAADASSLNSSTQRDQHAGRIRGIVRFAQIATDSGSIAHAHVSHPAEGLGQSEIFLANQRGHFSFTDGNQAADS